MVLTWEWDRNSRITAELMDRVVFADNEGDDFIKGRIFALKWCIWGAFSMAKEAAVMWDEVNFLTNARYGMH